MVSSRQVYTLPHTHNADSLSQEAFSFYFYYFPYGLLAPRGKHSGKNNLCVTSVRNFFKTNQSRDAGNWLPLWVFSLNKYFSYICPLTFIRQCMTELIIQVTEHEHGLVLLIHIWLPWKAPFPWCPFLTQEAYTEISQKKLICFK